MARPVKTLDAKKFDYEKFDSDIRRINKEKKMTMVRLSEEVALRSGSYLQKALSEKAMPANVAIAVAKWAELDLKDYEIKPVKRVKEKPVVSEQTIEQAVEQKVSEKGWSCVVKVDEEFGMAMMKVFKDGKEIALGRSYTYGHDDTGIVQGISYAAHMCYKQVQQAKMAQESIRTIPEKEEISQDEDGDDDEEVEVVGRVVFRDWIQKYGNDNSKAGRLARFIQSHYDKVPATGKKKIRSYLRLNKGEAHLTTFDSLWSMYQKWYETEFDNGNIKLGLAV